MLNNASHLKARLASPMRALLLALGAAAAAAATAACCPEPPHRTLSASGSGEALAPPDEASVKLRVTSTAPTPQLARVENEAVSAALLDELRRVVPTDAITQEGLTIAPRSVPVDPADPSKGYKLDGYEATRYVTVAVRGSASIAVVPTVVAAATRADTRDASEVLVDSVGYSLSPAAAARAQRAALARAVADALGSARTMAAALGDALGPALRVSQGGGYVPRPLMYASKEGGGGGGGAGGDVNEGAYATGDLRVTASVSADFALLGGGGGAGRDGRRLTAAASDGGGRGGAGPGRGGGAQHWV